MNIIGRRRFMRALPGAPLPGTPATPTFTQGVVAADNGNGTAQVAIGTGNPVSMAHLASYTGITSGDTVRILREGGKHTVLGALATTPAPTVPNAIPGILAQLAVNSLAVAGVSATGVVGTPPTTPVGSTWLIQTGYNNSAALSSGQYTQPFPASFPNGLLFAAAVPVSATQMDATLRSSAAGTSTAQAVFNFWAGTAAATGTIEFVWVAIGF
jgi:hypothetical protein